MKRSIAIVTLIATLAFLASAGSALAKEVTLNGEAVCAKCMLKQGTKCQTVIQVEKRGKTLDYYVMNNDIAKTFHENVCHAGKKVTATGTVKRVDGKRELTLTKIELEK